MMDIELNTVYHMDNREGLPLIHEKSINLIIADPPYFEVKGEFDFVWKSFDEYLEFMEGQAKLYKRVLAENGTLYVYGDAKNIAYVQVIFDRHFTILNNIVWENTNAHKQQIRFSDELRSFAPITERILMYCHNDDYHDTVRLAIKEVQEYLSTIISRDKLANLLLVNGICKNIASAKQNANNILNQRSAKPQLITEKQYELIQGEKRQYREIQEMYERSRAYYDAQRRPFDNFRNYGDVIRLPNYETTDYDHETIKPQELTRILILTSSKKGDLVCVPFAGSGTECAMAAKENRRFIGFDRSIDHVKTARRRVHSILAQPVLFQ